MEHPIIALARQAIIHYLTHRQFLDPPRELPPALQGQAGVFVSLKSGGGLRGCIGTCAATQPDVAREIIRKAASAATADPRFPPLRLHELEGLEISVDVLTPPERVAYEETLDPKRYGVIVRAQERVGVLLPDLTQITTAEQQLAIARRKAGITPDELVEIHRFEVMRFR